jgi:hypothetical protein
MISAPTGGRPKVIGSSIAMVATEPMPGSTPIKVPTSAPIMQNSMFIGEKATPKPNARFARRSDMTAIQIQSYATPTNFKNGPRMSLKNSASCCQSSTGAFGCGQSWNGRLSR